MSISGNRKSLYKKICAAAMALVMAFSISACGGAKDTHRKVDWEPVATLTLALRDGTYADVIEKCIEDFEEETHVYCNVLKLGEDELHSGVAKDADSPTGKYDLCMVDGSWMAEYTANDVLLNLSDYGYELDDDIIEATKKVCYRDGSVYLAPYYGNVTILLYNKRLVYAAGYENGEIGSLEDMYKICEYAHAHRNIGFLYRGDTENNIVVDFMPILLSFGGSLVDDDNRPTINTSEFKRAMNFYLRLIATGKAETRDNLILAIVNQAGAMGVGWPGWYTPERNGQAEYEALTGKAREDSVAYNSNVYGIWTIGVTNNSQNKDYAVQLLEYLMDPEVQKQTVSYGGVPCRYSSLKDPAVLEEFPQYETICEALENGVYRPIMENWTEFYTILGGYMRKMMNGELSIGDGLQLAQTELEKLE